MEKSAILVVDDERNIRLTVARALEPLGNPVHTVMNAEEALQELREGAFGLIFLDLKMPGMSGLELLRLVRDEWPRTKIVIITAHGTIESAVTALKLGAADFIQKPFSPNEIRELATRLLGPGGSEGGVAVDYPTLIERGREHISDRRFPEARDTVLKAVANDPTRPEAFNLLGALEEIAGDWLSAQKFYRAALDLDPTFSPATANLERTTSWSKTGEIDLGGLCWSPESRSSRGEGGEGGR